MKGKFITIEGIDGAGKSSVASRLHNILKNKVDVVLTSEPTNTWLGSAVARCIKENLNPFTEVFLFMGDRAEHTIQIKAQLENGVWVVSDRYCDSTYAYQSVALEKYMDNPLGWLMKISEPFIIIPDKTYLLCVDPEISLNRIKFRDEKTKFERLSYLRKVDKNYLYLSTLQKDRFVKIDASKPLEDVVKDIINSLP